ncbi:Extracellular sulfatase SULF-1-like [Colletotrichum gloeosporioides]|uniref:Extracellular sulfatase SULF-1-like n=1 Tax=Colletotrichum gloeosporioides TaxID=474922 RepID=A0A8H4CX62_COLGL|nr:Extracellular sulfatase SULF-1-like [Colletotrichum gloeosporioides]KAF3811691.1 Extracellular sulfatase SULF-1-like [Colletotrichum gloeosporioides]
MRVSHLVHAILAASLVSSASLRPKKPNIVFIMTDDQDCRLGSTDFQSILHRELISKGTEFTNHWTTTAQCCPSRAGLLRGQQSHNTNITHGKFQDTCILILIDAKISRRGSYDKWTLAGEDNDYLPHWLKKAGY